MNPNYHRYSIFHPRIWTKLELSTGQIHRHDISIQDFILRIEPKKNEPIHKKQTSVHHTDRI